MTTSIRTIKFRFIKLFLLCMVIHSNQLLCATDTIKKAENTIAYDSSMVEVKKLPKEQQEELLQNSDYKYDKVGPAPKTPWEKFLDWLDRLFSDTFSGTGGTIAGTVIQYMLIFGAIAAIIILLLKNRARALFFGKSASVNIDLKEFDADINAIDFNKLIAEALASKDLRKAVRLHFLKLLKNLSDKNLIQWKIDKTNHDYSIELKNSKFDTQFKEIAMLYEYYWYGDFPIDEAKYNATVEKFKTIVL